MKTIVAFRIGRGGRFNNPGHLFYLGQRGIEMFTEDLFIAHINDEHVYVNDQQRQVGLTLKEARTGIGMIDQDGHYDTIYTKHIQQCNERELDCILKSGNISNELIETIEALCER